MFDPCSSSELRVAFSALVLDNVEVNESQCGMSIELGSCGLNGGAHFDAISEPRLKCFGKEGTEQSEGGSENSLQAY